MHKDFSKVKEKNVTLENTIIPLFRRTKATHCKLKSLYEIEKDIRWKIYTNLYEYNITCEGIYITKGINDINGFRNCGKTSVCSHICINLYFNDLLHFFHLFYTTYFCFENFLKERNLKNKFSKEFSIKLKRQKKIFCKENRSFIELQEVINYLVETFIKKYGTRKIHPIYKTSEEANIDATQKERSMKQNIQNILHEPNQFSKKKVIYIDLDGGFYMERYNNMIRSTIDRIQNLMKTYLQFVSEQKCVSFLLFLENKKLKKKLFQIYKNYKKEHFFFIDLFNYYLEKYITDISFNDVFASLQILKIFHFNELINIVSFIYKQIEKYYLSYSFTSSDSSISNRRHSLLLHFNKYVSPYLGIVVIDNLYYLYKSSEYSVNLKNQLIKMLKQLSALSTRYKVCVLVTNNYNKYSKVCDELFNRLYSPYVWDRVLLKFLNKKLYYERNYHRKEAKRSTSEIETFSLNDKDTQKTAESDYYHFCEQRFNSRYIQVQKKKKKYSFFFEIKSQGIQMIMD